MFNALAINALAGTLLIVGIWSRLASTVATLQEAPSWSTPLRRVILVALPRFALAYLLYSGLLDMSAARIVFGLLVFTIALHVPVLVDAFLALIDAPLDKLQRIIWLTLPAIGACVGTFGVASMEWREPNGLTVQYIDGRLAPIGGVMSLSVLVVYGLLYRQVLRARSERSQRTQKILLYSIALNIAIILHDIVVALNELNNPYLGILGVIVVVLGLILAGEERAKVQIDALRRSTHEAEARAEARTSFLSHMSHQVRTPLTEIRGLQFLLQDRAQSASQIELAQTLGTSAEILRTLIEDLLDYEAIDTDQLELENAPFKPRQLHDELEQFASLLPRPERVELTFEYNGPEQLVVEGDANRLRQILLNLLSNALRFTHAGWVRAVTNLTVDGDQAELVIEIRDSGIGIAPERTEAIFESFVQGETGTSRRYDGSGLGLAISKRLTDLLGATLEVDSRLQEGSTFRVTLRLPIVALEQGEAIDEPLQSPDAEAFAGLKVLVVEDTPTNLLITRLLLEDMGCTVSTSSDGVEALDKLQKNGLEVVLMDLQMAPWDGIETTRRIRKAEDYDQLGHIGAIPIIAVTADISPSAKSASAEAGCDGFLAKPFTREELMRALWRQLPRTPAAKSDAPPDRSLPPISTSLLLQATHGRQELAIRRLEEFQRDVMELLKEAAEPASGQTDELINQTRRWLKQAEQLGLSEMNVCLAELVVAIPEGDPARHASVLERCWAAHRALHRRTMQLRQSFETAAYPQGKTQEFPDLPEPLKPPDR